MPGKKKRIYDLNRSLPDLVATDLNEPGHEIWENVSYIKPFIAVGDFEGNGNVIVIIFSGGTRTYIFGKNADVPIEIDLCGELFGNVVSYFVVGCHGNRNVVFAGLAVGNIVMLRLDRHESQSLFWKVLLSTSAVNISSVSSMCFKNSGNLLYFAGPPDFSHLSDIDHSTSINGMVSSRSVVSSLSISSTAEIRAVNSMEITGTVLCMITVNIGSTPMLILGLSSGAIVLYDMTSEPGKMVQSVVAVSLSSISHLTSLPDRLIAASTDGNLSIWTMQPGNMLLFVNDVNLFAPICCLSSTSESAFAAAFDGQIIQCSFDQFHVISVCSIQGIICASFNQDQSEVIFLLESNLVIVQPISPDRSCQVAAKNDVCDVIIDLCRQSNHHLVSQVFQAHLSNQITKEAMIELGPIIIAIAEQKTE